MRCSKRRSTSATRRRASKECPPSSRSRPGPDGGDLQELLPSGPAPAPARPGGRGAVRRAVCRGGRGRPPPCRAGRRFEGREGRARSILPLGLRAGRPGRRSRRGACTPASWPAARPHLRGQGLGVCPRIVSWRGQIVLARGEVGHQALVPSRAVLHQHRCAPTRGWRARVASTSPGSMRWPRILTWRSRRPRNSSTPPAPRPALLILQRTRSPVR